MWIRRVRILNADSTLNVHSIVFDHCNKDWENPLRDGLDFNFFIFLEYVICLIQLIVSNGIGHDSKTMLTDWNSWHQWCSSSTQNSENTNSLHKIVSNLKRQQQRQTHGINSKLRRKIAAATFSRTIQNRGENITTGVFIIAENYFSMSKRQ